MSPQGRFTPGGCILYSGVRVDRLFAWVSWSKKRRYNPPPQSFPIPTCQANVPSLRFIAIRRKCTKSLWKFFPILIIFFFKIPHHVQMLWGPFNASHAGRSFRTFVLRPGGGLRSVQMEAIAGLRLCRPPVRWEPSAPPPIVFYL